MRGVVTLGGCGDRFVYSRPGEAPSYRLVFTTMGPGRGDVALTRTTATASHIGAGALRRTFIVRGFEVVRILHGVLLSHRITRQRSLGAPGTQGGTQTGPDSIRTDRVSGGEQRAPVPGAEDRASGTRRGHGGAQPRLPGLTGEHQRGVGPGNGGHVHRETRRTRILALTSQLPLPRLPVNAVVSAK